MLLPVELARAKKYEEGWRFTMQGHGADTYLRGVQPRVVDAPMKSADTNTSGKGAKAPG